MDSPALNLINANLHLLLEPVIVGKQLGNGLLHQIVGASSCPGGQFVQLRILTFEQMYFRAKRLGSDFRTVKHVSRRNQPPAPTQFNYPLSKSPNNALHYDASEATHGTH